MCIGSILNLVNIKHNQLFYKSNSDNLNDINCKNMYNDDGPSQIDQLTENDNPLRTAIGNFASQRKGNGVR